MYQFSENIVKKVYVTPIVEFEMMEEEMHVMAGSVTGGAGGTGNNEDNEDPNFSKQSDFVFGEEVEFQIDGME